ncbi:RHS repeat protein [Massilia sp. H-1]|nr:RHS repeat protein [Massilia sp. H-1]
MNSPDTGSTKYEYDDTGSLVSIRDARGIVTEYRHDAALRVTQIGSSTFEYGARGSSAVGRLTTMFDDSGKSTFSYDDFGRLQARVQTVGNSAAAKRFCASIRIREKR